MRQVVGVKHQQFGMQKIDLHVRMWPLFLECGPDVRMPGEDSRNVTASFFRASLRLPRWRSLPVDVLLGSEKQEQKKRVV